MHNSITTINFWVSFQSFFYADLAMCCSNVPSLESWWALSELALAFEPKSRFLELAPAGARAGMCHDSRAIFQAISP